MAHQFKAGDPVQHKSGGPKMTVADYRKTDEQYRCTWFAEAKLQEGYFSEAELQAYKETGPARPVRLTRS